MNNKRKLNLKKEKKHKKNNNQSILKIKNYNKTKMGLLHNCCIQGEKKYEDNMTRASTLHSAFVGRMDGPYNIISVGNESPIEIKTTSLINNSKYGSPYDDYDIIGLVGIGTYGKTFKIKHKITGKIKNMKVINENQLKINFKEDDLIHEIKVLKSIN